MSAPSLPSLSSLDPSLGQSKLPPIDPALEPASVRNGPAAAKQAYQSGLAFEEMLVSELAKELASTVSTTGDDSAGSGDRSGDAAGQPMGGMMGSDPASSEYAQVLTGALTQALMSGGGMGIAQKLAQAFDPALAGPQKPPHHTQEDHR